MHTIVVGTESSERSQDAVALAALLARSTGAQLRLVHVIFPSLTVEVAAELAEISHDLDLLVMGSRGYRPLHAVLVGGVSGQVAREAACPVLVVPRGATVTSLGTAQAASAGA